LQVLSNQIRNLRNKNNNYSRTVTKLQEENANIKKELKELKNMILNIQNKSYTTSKTSKKNLDTCNIFNKRKSSLIKSTDFSKNRSYTNLQVVNKYGNKKPEQGFITLSEFNKKCGTNIKDENIKELNLISYNLGNDIIDYLSQIKLEQLQLLYLSYNNILDISNLDNVNLNQLSFLIHFSYLHT
jgi:hypothetical protein